jgi:hypothetical protein
MVLRSDRMVVGFLQAIGICSLHLINVCIKKNADSNSSLQLQQQILYLLRQNSVQEFIA